MIPGRPGRYQEIGLRKSHDGYWQPPCYRGGWVTRRLIHGPLEVLGRLGTTEERLMTFALALVRRRLNW